MDLMTVLEIIKSVGLLLIGIGLTGYTVGEIIERRNDGKTEV